MSAIEAALFTSFCWWFSVFAIMCAGGRRKAIEYGIWDGSIGQWFRLALVNAIWPIVLSNAAMRRDGDE